MTVVPSRPPHRSPSTWIQTLKRTSPSPAERMYLLLAACLCVGLLVSWGVGRWIGLTQLQSQMPVADGQPGKSGLLPAAGSAHAASSDQVNPDLVPVVAPQWVQAFRATQLWGAPTGGASTVALGQWQFLRVTSADQRRLRVETLPVDGPVSNGWVDLDDVGISGPPPDWVVASRDAALFAGPDSDDRVTSVPSGTAMLVCG